MWLNTLDFLPLGNLEHNHLNGWDAGSKDQLPLDADPR